MSHKVLISSIASVLALGTIFAPASTAASVKSGNSCTKLNATTKIKYMGDTYVYKCVKNPLYKKTKLTWTLQECIDAIKDYKSALAAINTTKAAGGTPTTTDMTLLDTAKQLRDMSCQAGI